MARVRFWRRGRPAPVIPAPAGSILPGRALLTPSVVPPPREQPPAAETTASASAEDVRPAASELARPDPAPAAPADGPRVGLVCGDGTHVVLDPDDPRARRFAALADELNR
jgi:hypothetical protein